MSKENISDMSTEERYTYLLFMRLEIQDMKIRPIDKIIGLGGINYTIKLAELHLTLKYEKI